jgi:AcrR family transcriptional regulator
MPTGTRTVVDTRPDRRAQRREAKRRTIIAEAWALAERDGLGAISLRDLAERVDLRQPSLYAYFDSKLALYDAMFADANNVLLDTIRQLPALDDPRAALIQFTRACVDFSSRNIVRHRLLFDRTIPGFEPSEEAFRPAIEFYRVGVRFLTAAGATAPDDADVLSGLVAGLAHQQVANDPGGDRWVVLIPRVVDMFLADVERRHSPEGSSA